MNQHPAPRGAGSARAQLREAELRTRAIVDTVLEGIVTINAAGIVESFNPAAERLFGYAAGEVIGNNVSMLMPPPYHEEHDAYLSRYLATGEARIIGVGREVVGLRKDGSTFPMDLAVTDTILAGRHLFTGVIRDVTDRKRYEEALRATEGRLRLLADAGAALTNATTVESVVEAAACTIAREFADLCIIDLFEGNVVKRATVSSSPRVDAALALALRDHPPRASNRSDPAVQAFHSAEPVLDTGPAGGPCFARSEAHRELLLRLAPQSTILVRLQHHDIRAGVMVLSRMAADRPFLAADHGTAADLGRRIAARLTSVRLTRDLRKANAVKDEVLGLVSHELRTPLTTLKGNVSVLRRHLDKLDPETRESVFNDLEQDAERLESIVENMLLLARIDGRGQYEPEPLLLRRVVESVIAEHVRRVPNFRIALETTHDVLPVMGHEAYIRQVLLNLLTNAAKYGAPGAAVEVAVQRDGREAVLLVSDRGPGISSEAAGRVFEPFYRAIEHLDSASGMGLGLAVCKRLVEEQGGRIWVAQRDGGGTTFGCAFPVIEED